MSGFFSNFHFLRPWWLLALVALFAAFPFLERLRVGPIIESILLTIALISAILAIAGRGRILVTAVILAIPTLAGRWIAQKL